MHALSTCSHLFSMASLFLLLAAPATAQPVDTLRVFPGTPAGRVAADWFRAFSADEPAMTRFFAGSGASPTAPPLSARLERWRSMRAEMGRLVPVRVLRSEPGEIEVLAKGEREWLRIALACAPEPPHAFGGLRVEQAEGSEQPRAQAAMTEAQIVDSLGRHLARETQAQRFSGTVRLERRGRVLFERAYGLADAQAGRANTVATRYNLGSIDKLLTQAAIARLVDQGRIGLDDTLSRHLPDFPRDKASRITIRQLLDMQSGLGDFFGERYEAADRSKLRELRDWLPLFVDKPLEFEPGKGRRYSNAGYLTLGLVIERLTGKPYRDAVRDLVLTPAGMTETAQLAADERTGDVARGSTRRGAGEVPVSNESTLPWRGSSAGGGYSTVADLARFAQALREGRIVKGETACRMLRMAPLPSGGFAIQIAAAGGSPGVNGAVEAETDWTLVVLTNLDPPAAESVALMVRDWMEHLAD